MMALIDQYNDHFELQTGEELVEAAQQVVADLGLSPKVGDITERLLRHYVTEGVVSRPVREGREVRYGFRHLLELLAVRMWVLQGYPLSNARAFSVGQPSNSIIEALKEFRIDDQPASAEMLVKMFRASSAPEPGTLRDISRMYSASPAAVGRKPVPSNSASLGMADVLQEMRTLEADMKHHLRELAERFSAMAKTHEQTTRLLERVEDQQRMLISTADQQREFVRAMIRDLLDEHTAKIIAEVRITRLNEANEKPDNNPAP